MIIIKTTNGDRLRLTSKRLTEIDHYTSRDEENEEEPTQYPFHTTKGELKFALVDEKESGEGQILVTGRFDDDHASSNGEMHSTFVPFDSQRNRIGCKTFTRTTFNLILKTMGLKRL
jgi:hypothetical protein